MKRRNVSKAGRLIPFLLQPGQYFSSEQCASSPDTSQLVNVKLRLAALIELCGLIKRDGCCFEKLT